MKTRYEQELDRLNDVYSVAITEDVSPLARFVEDCLAEPLITVGSGGSFSTATFAAWLHQRFAKRVSKPMFPLEIIRNGTFGNGALFFSAGGSNKDIRAAFKHSAESGIFPLNAIIMKHGSLLETLIRKHTGKSSYCFSNPYYQDGFLAVATVIATAIILLRAYNQATGVDLQMPNSLDKLLQIALPNIDQIQSLDFETNASNKFLSVLHSDDYRTVAVDLESRFTEAALGAVHTSDLRNFGHGRHFWFVRNPSNTSIVAFVSPDDKVLADKTIEIIPSANVMRIDFEGNAELACIAGLVVGFHITAAFGRHTGVDPGRPGVSDFGRKLYHLGPMLPRTKSSLTNKKYAVNKKSRGINLLYERFEIAYEKVRERYSEAQFKGIVVDYDGTICDQEHRRTNMPEASSLAIQRILNNGLHFGIATGRGDSAGIAIREQLPKDLWNKVVIGYYNGAVVSTLADVECLANKKSNRSHPLIESLQSLRNHKNCGIRANKYQISVNTETASTVKFELAQLKQIVEIRGLKVVSSGHSLDILLHGQSKLNVVLEVASRANCGIDGILRIGDKGNTDGNDFALLNHKFGLSVDETSQSLENCWFLAPAEKKGLRATLWYLERTVCKNGYASLNL